MIVVSDGVLDKVIMDAVRCVYAIPIVVREKITRESVVATREECTVIVVCESIVTYSVVPTRDVNTIMVPCDGAA